MKADIKKIMYDRAEQRKRSLAIKGFKCQEIGYKKYLDNKSTLKTLEERLLKLKSMNYSEEKLNRFTAIYKYSITVRKKDVERYEKKNNINQELKKSDKTQVKSKGVIQRISRLFQNTKDRKQKATFRRFLKSK